MRLLLTATASADGDVVDLAIDCEEDATVADIARQLAAHVQPAEQARVVRTAGRHLGVVDDDASVLRDEPALPPTLYLGQQPLEPATPVVESDLRNGALVGVGVPLPDVFAERTGLVEVRTVSGRGAGHVDTLAAGSHEVGTRTGCTVRLHEPGAPAVALRLDVALDGTVTATPEPSVAGVEVAPPVREYPLDGPIVIPKIEDETDPKPRKRRRHKKKMEELARLKDPHLTIDPEGDRPFVHIDRVGLTEPTVWEPGSALVVGDTVLELAVPSEPDASLSPSPGGVTLDYNRPPRLLPPPRQTEFRLPNEPKKPEKTPLPWAIALAPMIMGGTMFFITGSPFSLMIMILSPLMMVARYKQSKGQVQNRYANDMKNYVERKRNIENQAYQALVTERAARRRDIPDPAAVLLFATGPRARLWERRRTDPDWLLVRVGTADVPSEVSLTDPAREEHERVLNWTTPNVPVGVPLAEAGVMGVAGDDVERRQVSSWVVAQLAALHSPADVEVVVLSDVEGGDAWNWVRWLPHVRRNETSEVIAGVGADEDTTGRRVAELMAVMERRKEAANDRGSGLTSSREMSFPPLLVVLDGARRIRLIPGLISLLRDGPKLGMYFLCIDADERLLPEECRAVVAIGAESTTVRRTGEPTIEGVWPDLVSPAWCERMARAVAPVKDVSSEDLSSALPSSSRLLDVLKLENPTSEAIQGWWTNVGRTTKSVIGEGMDGPFAVDIRADGPHGLVAGTTGSGKSELLQTMIASLAVANRPDEMTFVLVDYKGGAAFKDCNNLPHTVGMVTDLDGHLTTRALESLAAELHRREHQLAESGKKDIEDYLAAKGPDDEPMPRLMIVIDEFAALVAELPDFVKGLVDIARRGRSLGVHLILATQRPAGVVSSEIKSNTNLRIALRVTDGNDSQDVIESKEASEISKSTPGRGYARLGHSSLVAFQSARVGGRPSAPDAVAAVDLRQLSWESLGKPPDRTDDEEEEEDVSIPTDLESVVTAINEASSDSGVVAPPPPWLPALDDVVTLDQVLADPAVQVQQRREIRLPFGIVDVPKEQRRAVAEYDLSGGGHLSVVGAPRTGRSSVLRAFAGVVGRTMSPRDVHLYGVDCGNNALLSMVGLPHTGAVVSRDQPDRLSRLSTRIRAEIGRRQQVLAEQGYSDLSEQRAGAEPDKRLPYILVLFDRWEGFVQSFENFDSGKLIDQWMQILQEGAAVGVKVVLAADRTALVGRLSALLEDKMMLRMTDSTDFGNIGKQPKSVPEHMPPGRAFRAEGLLETQVALLVEDQEGTAQVAALQEIGREATERHADVPRALRPFRVDPLPTRLSYADALDMADGQLAPTELPVAVGGDTLTLRTLDTIDHGPGILVLGPRRSGRSTTLLTMATSALDRGWRMLIITPRRSPLGQLSGRDGVEAVINLEGEKDEVTNLFESMVPAKDGPPTAVVIDDMELMGVDGWLVDLLTKHVPKLRDTGSTVIAGATTDDLGSSYRGPAAVLKKSRSGVLLSPASTSDGDHYGLKLPRSLTGGMPPGRGIYVAAGQWQLVQVPETTTGT
ncbi:S-DNA-T family DNA segregation ATPase FtsK/SpoIIIE [Haloactinopolyspora alba]|uniref:S-DNA-T family DNA segregation ATPase FtsK/SpoIIIE n=1 Tax=Haloactinopolyspora alba TaxID=648780 RepID=A0A2P8EBD4_9ACTN|nr:FtsK/SpoIIIE domain-containing protein [Haloactinopolyspora alba]PSL06779.1 S-DNA-T family DNA segregation ATPase FtsK/SpoIIIE [Haloactinopolyspora alba]